MIVEAVEKSKIESRHNSNGSKYFHKSNHSNNEPFDYITETIIPTVNETKEIKHPFLNEDSHNSSQMSRTRQQRMKKRNSKIEDAIITEEDCWQNETVSKSFQALSLNSIIVNKFK